MDTVTFLPDPAPRPRHFTVVSVDDHVVEPPDLFAGRLPASLAARAPRIVELEDGTQQWLVEDRLIPNLGINAVAGRPPSEYSDGPVRFEHMRRGAYDVDARIADMDLAGIAASLCFPSTVAGFAGARFSEIRDHVLGLATLRAWNDWHLESWVGRHPERLLTLQLPWLNDPDVGAHELRRNAERGVTALSFPEFPERLGLPSIHSGHWDPLLEACAETGTVVCLHVGSSSWVTQTSDDAPDEVIATMFFVGSIIATTDWLYSKVCVRFPGLKIVIAEGGIGWVPTLIDRIEHCFKYREFTRGWLCEDMHPVEVLRRNFWFCALDDTAAFDAIDRIGVDRTMVECDYPHADSTWPDTQLSLQRQLGHLPQSTIDNLTWKTACQLFRFSLGAAHTAEAAARHTEFHTLGRISF